MAQTTALDPGEHALDEVEFVAEAEGAGVAIVDDALLAFVGRELVSGSEVVDRLLDLRSALIASTALPRVCVTSQS